MVRQTQISFLESYKQYAKKLTDFIDSSAIIFPAWYLDGLSQLSLAVTLMVISTRQLTLLLVELQRWNLS